MIKILPSFSRSHPNFLLSILCATHSLTSVVLPKPAGAETRVSLRPEETTLVQPLDQAGAQDYPRPARGDVEFRG